MVDRTAQCLAEVIDVKQRGEQGYRQRLVAPPSLAEPVDGRTLSVRRHVPSPAIVGELDGKTHVASE